MKRFVKIMGLFLLPCVCILGLLEYGMRSVPNNYTYKNNWLQDNISNVHIWSFGSSHGFYGISPRCFSKPAFNSAHVSQSLKYDAFIFNKYIEKADSLEWVILPISYFTLTSNIEDGTEWWRVKNYCIYYDCPYHEYEIKYNYEIVGNPLPFFEQLRRIFRYWTMGMNDLNCDSFGLGLDYTKESRETEGWWLDGKQRVKYHSCNVVEKRATIQQNITYLNDIVASCANNNVQVLLLTTPVCSTYYDNVDSIQYALMIETCDSIVSTCTNVYYLNLFKDARFVEDDFYNSDHLVSEGAEKLTNIIDDYIRKEN